MRHLQGRRVVRMRVVTNFEVGTGSNAQIRHRVRSNPFPDGSCTSGLQNLTVGARETKLDPEMDLEPFPFPSQNPFLASVDREMEMDLGRKWKWIHFHFRSESISWYPS